MNALDICNACDAEVKTPNKFGYCDQCLKEMRAANMTTNSKPTKGPDVYGVLTAAERGMQFFRDGGTRQHYIESLQRTRPFVEEAQDVYRSTGLTPRELKEQRDRLIEAAQYTLDVARHAGWLGSDCFPKLKAAIANGIIPD